MTSVFRSKKSSVISSKKTNLTPFGSESYNDCDTLTHRIIHIATLSVLISVENL